MAEYKKVEMTKISWVKIKNEFKKDSRTSWIVDGKKNVAYFIAKNIFCDNYDANVQDTYFKILKQCNGIIEPNENDSFKHMYRSFAVSDSVWATEAFTAFKDLVNTDPVLMGKIRISESSKDEYDRQMKEYDKKNISTDVKNSNFDQTKGKKEIKKKTPADNEKLREEIEKCWINENLCFCADDVVKKGDVVNILTGLFPGMKNIFTERYQIMCTNWHCDWRSNKNKWKQTESDLELVEPVEITFTDKNGDPKTRTIFLDALLAVPNRYWQSDWNSEIFKKYNNIGHDMPTWLYYKTNTEGNAFPVEDRPRVMLISQDPLRSDHGEDKRLFLSTPWAFHSWNYLRDTIDQSIHLRLPLKIAHMYMNYGAMVYLTDFYKIYCRKGKERYEIQEDVHIKNLMKDTLKKEIKLFRPQIIIVFGNLAIEAITGSCIKDYPYSMEQTAHFLDSGEPAKEWIKILEEMKFKVMYTKDHMRMNYSPESCFFL